MLIVVIFKEGKNWDLRKTLYKKITIEVIYKYWKKNINIQKSKNIKIKKNINKNSFIYYVLPNGY